MTTKKIARLSPLAHLIVIAPIYHLSKGEGIIFNNKNEITLIRTKKKAGGKLGTYYIQ
jgi:hypothetical protein